MSWKETFDVPDERGRPQAFSVERHPWDRGVEIVVTRLSDGTTWSRSVSSDEYEAWNYVDSVLQRMGDTEKRVLVLLSLLGAGSSTFLSGLLGWTRGTASARLSELRGRGFIEELKDWRRVTLEPEVAPELAPLPCPECGSKQVFKDPETGEYVCRSCGFVLTRRKRSA